MLLQVQRLAALLQFLDLVVLLAAQGLVDLFDLLVALPKLTHQLQPLGTEGQGLNGTRPYSRLSVALPFGAGLRWKLSRYHTLNFELGYRFTLTDYLDDVSTTYYNNQEIREARGAVAAYFADPSIKTLPDATRVGEKRGNPEHNDGYLVFSIQYVYKLQKKRTWF